MEPFTNPLYIPPEVRAIMKEIERRQIDEFFEMEDKIMMDQINSMKDPDIKTTLPNTDEGEE